MTEEAIHTPTTQRIVEQFQKELEEGVFSIEEGPYIIEKRFAAEVKSIMAEGNIPEDWDFRAMRISRMVHINMMEQIVGKENYHWLVRTILEEKATGELYGRGLSFLSPEGQKRIDDQIAMWDAQKETKH